ncbi:MAG: alpha/beta hydrolase [Phormidesmis sp.]
MEFYNWKEHRCAFEQLPGDGEAALLLIHPIGVGLSSEYWRPFIQQWQARETSSPIYNLDLLGCGQSDMPQRALTPQDWAEQVAYFIEKIATGPVVLVVQGALLPVAVEVMAEVMATRAAEKVVGMVLSGPPAWRLMTTPTAPWKQRLAWGLLASPLGNLFYRYARREKFLRSFSERQLFEQPKDVDDRWLAMLAEGSKDMDSRYAVFSFLAGFWRQDYAAKIALIQQPVLIVMGENASTIDRTTAKQVERQVEESETVEQASRKRLQDYLDHFPRAQGVSVSGRNVMPYEATDDFVRAIAPFVSNLSD